LVHYRARELPVAAYGECEGLLRRHREEHGLSQEELADRAGLSARLTAYRKRRGG